MSQKNVSNKMSTNSKTTPKTAPKAVVKSTRTSQAKTLNKSEEKIERKTNTLINKSDKNPVKTTVNRVKGVNTISDKKKLNLTTAETMRKKSENVSKTTTNSISKPVSRNLNTNTKTTNQSIIKSNDTNRRLVNKSNDITKKEVKVNRNVINNEKKQTISKKIDQAPTKKEIPLHKRHALTTTTISENVENGSVDTNDKESEDMINKESSDEQYVSLATLESYSSYKKSHKSSESVQAEPPSVCDTDIEDMMNNTTDNQINDDFPSDYCDDFEDYESDFEDDDEQEEEEEKEPENYVNEEESVDVSRENKEEDGEEPQENNNYQDLHRRRDNEIEKYETNYKNNKILPQKSIAEEKDKSHESDVTPIEISNVIPNDSYKTLTESVKSAKLRSEVEIQKNKSMKRSKELLEIIKLNEISFTNFDLPQINYELFIKTFGRKDTKQVSCQTSQREDNETQTDFVQMLEKWTQNPSFTRLVSGDQNQMNENLLSNDLEPRVNPFDLINFLTRAETLISAIIDQDDNHSISKRSLPKGTEQFSTQVSVIKCLSLAKKCPISYTFINSLYLFCVQNVSKIEGSAEKSMISVWSLMTDKSEPIRVLICRSHITKAFSEQNLVISAMIDGSVALWDLNQNCVTDKQLNFEANHFTLRGPVYNCALTSKGHEYPIVDIKRLFDTEYTDRLIHFGTIDENGFMIMWAITEGKEENIDCPLSQTNEHKITRISVTNYLDKLDLDPVKITAFECQPNDWSNFYCGTDNGVVIRCTSIEESIHNLPKIYQKSQLNSIWTKVSVIRFNESEISKFLVAFTDGLISYYSITDENPLIVLNSNEMSIIDLKLINNCSQMAFIALNNSNQILVWDLKSEQNFKPIIKYRHSNDRLWKGLKTYLIFGCDSGQTLIFDFCIQ